MPRIKLTKRAIDTLPAATRSRGEIYFDTEVRGFGVTCYPSGRKVFFYNYGPSRRRRRIKIAPYGEMTPTEARQAATKLAHAIRSGEDPHQERAAARAMPYLDEWIDSYLEDVRRRKMSWRDDRRFLGWCKKRWKGRRLDSLTTEELRQAFAVYGDGHTPIQANRWLASIRACLATAWRSDLIPSNPAAKVRKNPEPPPRERVLTDEEMSRLWKAIEDLKDVYARVGLVLLIVTGARRSDVLRARWDHFDLDEGIWRIPRSKARRPQLLPLTPATAEMLRAAPRGGEYVVTGRYPDRPRYDMRNAWDSVREQADLLDVYLTDVRRTYGLVVSREAGLHAASKLLRHSSITVTEKHYAPLGLDVLRAAQEKVERKRAKVIPIRRVR